MRNDFWWAFNQQQGSLLTCMICSVCFRYHIEVIGQILRGCLGEKEVGARVCVCVCVKGSAPVCQWAQSGDSEVSGDLEYLLTAA